MKRGFLSAACRCTGPVQIVRNAIKIQFRRNAPSDLLKGSRWKKGLIRREASDVVRIQPRRIIHAWDCAGERVRVGTVAILEVADLIREGNIVGMSRPGDARVLG